MKHFAQSSREYGRTVISPAGPLHYPHIKKMNDQLTKMDSFQSASVLKLPDEILLAIFAYQTPQELALFTTTCKRFISRVEYLRYHWWHQILVNKWGLGATTPLHHFQSNKGCYGDLDMRLLYPKAEPIGSSLSSDNENVNCINDTAIFVGIVGVSNRSVQAACSFPATRQSSNVNLQVYKILLDVLRSMYILQEDGPSNDPSLYRSIPFKIYDQVADKSYFYVKPRSIHFFEVEICKNGVEDKEEDQSAVEDEMDPSLDGFECVAVGLSTNSFQKQKRLPGWSVHDRMSHHTNNLSSSFHSESSFHLSIINPGMRSPMAFTAMTELSSTVEAGSCHLMARLLALTMLLAAVLTSALDPYSSH